LNWNESVSTRLPAHLRKEKKAAYFFGNKLLFANDKKRFAAENKKH